MLFSTKPIDMALDVKQTIIYFFHCIFFSCGLILQKTSKFGIPLKSAGKYFLKKAVCWDMFFGGLTGDNARI